MSIWVGYDEWYKSLKSGDIVIYDISSTFDWEMTYFIDKVKTVKDKHTVVTEAGLIFFNTQCYRNRKIMTIENPENDFRGNFDKLGKPFHKNFQESHKLKNVIFINDKMDINKIIGDEAKLNSVIKRSWNDLQHTTFSMDYDDAILEKQYRNDDGKIDYYASLIPCIGYHVDKGSLCFRENLLHKKCSHKIGKYMVYRKSLLQNKTTHWTPSSIYVYNSETGEIRQDPLGFITNTRYWLEYEYRSIDPTFPRSLDFYSVGVHKINVFKENRDRQLK